MVGHIEILAAIAVIGVIGFAGWRIMSKDKTPSNTDTPQASVSTQETAADLPTDLTDIKSVDEIQTQAATDAGTGLTIVGVELETEEGKAVYVVHLSDGSVLTYDAKTGNKLTMKDNGNDDIDKTKNLPAGFVAGVTIQQAIDAAKVALPNATVRKVELKVEDGVVLYSVKFKNGGKVDINATDGSVIKTVQGEQGSSNSSGSGSSSGNSSSGSDDDKDDDKNNSSSSDDDKDDDNTTSNSSGSETEKKS